MNLAVIGLGAMGGPMAAHLASSGHQVTVFDVVAERRTAAVEQGCRAAETARDAAGAADATIVMVATPAQADQVLHGEDGIAEVLSDGHVVVITGTVGPSWVQQTAAGLAGRGVQLVDAPVSGGVARAGTGDLVVLVSGPSPALGTVRPVLDHLGSTVTTFGEDVGLAQSVKLVNQLLCGVHIAVAAEAIGFAEALGLDSAEVFDTVRHGAAASFMLDDRGQRMVDQTYEPVKSALDIFVKDMGLVLDLARTAGFPTPLASMALQLYLSGAADGFGRRDDASLVEVYRSWVGDRPERH